MSRMGRVGIPSGHWWDQCKLLERGFGQNQAAQNKPAYNRLVLCYLILAESPRYYLGNKSVCPTDYHLKW